MIFISGLPYIILGIFGGFSIIRILSDRGSAFVTILLNVLFGGTLYIILNFCNVELPLNLISASSIALLGIPGVILLIALKLIFKIF